MTWRKMVLILLSFFSVPLCGTLKASEESTLIYDSNDAVAGLDLAVGSAFDDGSVQLNDLGKDLLNQFMQKVSLEPGVHLTICGYSDAAAAAEDDHRQSYGRALEVKASIHMLGYSTDNISRLAGLGIAERGSAGSKAPAHLKGHVEVRVLGLPPPRRAASATGQAPADAASSQALSSSEDHLAVGLGYPDLRLRVALGAGFDVEGKAAMEQGIQAYSARLLWNAMDLGPFKAVLGIEGGYATFNSVETLSGSAVIAGGSVGLELPFASRFRLNADVGPAFIQASAEGSTYATVAVAYNTALYIYLY